MREPLYGWTPDDEERCAFCGAVLHTRGTLCPDCMDEYKADLEDWEYE